MQDITQQCHDCNQEFVFTSGEQEFYQKKGLQTPKYCLICRGKYQASQKNSQKSTNQDE